MSDDAYLRMPAIRGDAIAFVAEDDLWLVDAGGGIARRLVSGRAECTTPRFSPDGAWLAFAGREEGNAEVYVVPAEGGPARRVTYTGADTLFVCGWSADGREILYTTDAGEPFAGVTAAFAVPAAGGAPRRFAWGHVRTFDLRADGAAALGRNAHDTARWKRYRGGTAGQVWVDPDGAGTFLRILREVDGNIVWPLWRGDELVVCSDHEGIANLYACRPDGSGLHALTAEQVHFARFPSTDGARLVYTAGAELRVVERDGAVRTVEVRVPSSAPQAQRRFVEAGEFLETVAPSPDGTRVALVARGRAVTMPLFEEAVTPLGDEGGAVAPRRREAVWLHDGTRIAYVEDDGEGERIAVAAADGTAPPTYVTDREIGRITALVASPAGDRLAYANHRHEVCVLELGGAPRVVDRSVAHAVGELAFAPDGRWLAYVVAPRRGTSAVRIADLEHGTTHPATTPLRVDRAPAWDPEGNYLYVLSSRDFEPVYDALQFELSFPLATRPYAIPLRRDVEDPFRPKPAPIHGKRDERDDDDEDDDGKARPRPPVRIDLEDLPARMLAFPVDTGDYHGLAAAKGRVLFSSFPLRGIRPSPRDDDDEHGGTLLAYDFEEQRAAPLARDIDDFVLGADHRTVLLVAHGRVRAIDAGGDLPEDDDGDEKPPTETGRKTGWLDLGRVSLPVDPPREWAQMYAEAWRLQREQFWDPGMAGVDWDAVRARYARLLPRIRTRSELSDLIWEMQGELGTSHAYEYGGDVRPAPPHRRGALGAVFAWDDAAGGWRIVALPRGDAWNRDEDSPLAAPGVGAQVGDVVLAVDGRALDAHTPPEARLVNLAGRDVTVTLRRGETTRRVVVRTLRDERMLRYRAWVAANRDAVHRATDGRVGYVHIPDMGPWGFSEFHRGYLDEFDRGGLIVDVRYNRGGHISPLLLEKLSRKRVGYDVSRWFPPVPYPEESVDGPLVAITNQFAGSDGDMFSHGFKLYGLGPLVGTRTWGGVIGIEPYHELVDGTLTTQPEYSFWFVDAGWGIENYGTDPTHEVDVAPQDTAAGRDPQLEAAIALALEALTSVYPRPSFPPPPSRAWPR